jgi:hypothetical protein
MQSLIFPTEVIIGPESGSIFCEKLGYHSMGASVDDAALGLIEMITVDDPMLVDVPKGKRVATFNKSTGELFIMFSDEMTAALLSRIRRVRKV